MGLLLVLGAGMTAGRLRSLTATETGFDPAGVLTFRIGANPQHYTGLEAKAAFYESSLRVVRAPPGVGRSALAAPRFVHALMVVFALLGLVLLVAGLYGVMSQSVTDRTQEIGLRVAPGATPARVVWLVLREGLALVATGLVLAAGVRATLLPAGRAAVPDPAHNLRAD